MKVAVACDHGGFALKDAVIKQILESGNEPLELGAHQLDPLDDYPDYAEAAARAVADHEADRAIVLCGSGVGACIAANKVVGVRASVCHDSYSARQGVEHDDMNTLCLGARIIGSELALEIVRNFLAAQFTAEERHQRRLRKVLAIEGKSRHSHP